MSKTKYSKDHEWVKLDGNVATVGITDYAQNALGDVVFVELPDVGKQLAQGAEAAVVESVKAASEVYAPISGKVSEVNQAVADQPDLVNSASESDGWFFKLEVSAPEEMDALMDKSAYDAFVASLD